MVADLRFPRGVGFSFRRHVAALLVSGIVAASAIGATSVPADALDKTTVEETPFVFDTYPTSLSGNYLAARHASAERDIEKAVAYYRDALATDPENPQLRERTFSLLMANGDIDESIDLARQIVETDKKNRFAQLVLGVKALRDRTFEKAQSHFQSASEGPLAELTTDLMVAWALQGAGKTDEAVRWLDNLKHPSGNDVFRAFHAGLIADLAGRKALAVERLGQAYAKDSNALRIVDAYARALARNGEKAKAIGILDTYIIKNGPHPLLEQTRERIETDAALGPLVSSVQAGGGEVLYWLGSAIGRDGFIELSAIYLQLARYLDPDAGLVTLALANIFERLKRYDRAIDLFKEVSEDSPLKRDAEIQIGQNYNILDNLEEARKHLAAEVERNPDDQEAVRALGNVLRGHKLFSEAAEVYSRGIEHLKDSSSRRNWRIYYYRGICYERTKRWPEAEADFKKALELSPDEPDVLNYLGYSWVDMKMNYDTALDMIRKAVELRPRDGYIIDSLGWAYYRLGRYEEAVRELERAVELKPSDPIINDHLGDAYWQVGRRLEARFQWSHARDLDPEPEELAKIEKKLSGGLTADTTDAAVVPTDAAK